MVTRTEKVMNTIGKILQKKLHGLDLDGGDLENILKRIQDGDTSAFEEIPNEIVEAARHGYISQDQTVSLYAPDFFARNRVEVAKDLCGSGLGLMDGFNYFSGTVLETAAYTVSKKDKSVAEAAPGTVGVWSAQGKSILIISAHESGDEGTVAVWGIGQYDKKLPMGLVGDNLKIRDYEGTIIGVNSPIVLMPRDISTDKSGHMYVDQITNKRALKGADAAYKIHLRNME